MYKRQVGIGDVCVALRCLCGEIVKRTFIAGKKIRQPFIICYIKQVPVVKAGTFELFVIYGKAHGPHKVQPRARGRAGAGDVAGVLGDLRLHQHDIQRFHG